MNILLINLDKSLRDSLIVSLIPRGIAVYAVETDDEALKVLRNQKMDFVFLDNDTTDYDFLGVFQYLAEEEKERLPRLILHSSSTDKKVIETFLNAGLVGFIPKKLLLKDLLVKLLNIINKNYLVNEKRKSLRIQPDESEKAKISIPKVAEGMGPSSSISGTIVDLSTLGIAFTFDKESDSKLFYEGQEISRAELYLDDKMLITSGKFGKVGPVSALIFTKIRPAFLSSISKYIFEKMKTMYD